MCGRQVDSKKVLAKVNLKKKGCHTRFVLITPPEHITGIYSVNENKLGFVCDRSETEACSL